MLTSEILYAHCSAHIQNVTEKRQIFYMILGMQAFALAIYSTLIYHHSTSTVCYLYLKQIKNYNILIYI